MPDLVKIKQYWTLAANVEGRLEGSACTITEAYGLLKNMQFDDNSCAIKNYIKKRLFNSDLETIINCTNLTIDPTSYALLQKAQPTFAAVERSFSTGCITKIFTPPTAKLVIGMTKLYSTL